VKENHSYHGSECKQDSGLDCNKCLNVVRFYLRLLLEKINLSFCKVHDRKSPKCELLSLSFHLIQVLINYSNDVLIISVNYCT
jgi:hypothetical protein